MKFHTLTLCLLGFVLLNAISIHCDDSTTTHDETTTTIKHETTEEPTQATTELIKTTSEKITTEEPETTTSEKITTKEPKTTTTEKITTKEPKTTTAEPKTTTTVAPPTPAPKPVVPTYDVMDESGNYCIMVESLTNLTISYFDKKNATQNKSFSLKDEHVEVSGKCSNETFISLVWTPGKPENEWEIKILFETVKDNNALNDNPKSYSITGMTIKYYLEEDIFPNSTYAGMVLVKSKGQLFKAHIGDYYQCDSVQTIQFKGEKSNGVLLSTKDTKIEAYHPTKSHKFVGNAQVCEQDKKPSNLVPILVGVGLAVMILVALVIFLIGSRRRAAAYESL